MSNLLNSVQIVSEAIALPTIKVNNYFSSSYFFTGFSLLPSIRNWILFFIIPLLGIVQSKRIMGLPFKIPIIKGYPLLRGQEKHQKRLWDDLNKWTEELKEKERLNKDKYVGLPERLIVMYYYMEYHISKYFYVDNWYEEITQYFLLSTASGFSNSLIGVSIYKQYCKQCVKYFRIDDARVTQEKRARILAFLEDIGEHGSNVFDSVFHQITQRWIESIPDLPFFREFKDKCRGRFLINVAYHKIQYNSDILIYIPKNGKELFYELYSFTDELLDSVDTYSFMEEITDIEDYGLKLRIENHRKKQILRRRISSTNRQDSSGYSLEEKKYIKSMQDWLELELEFFKEIEIHLEKSINKKKVKLTHPQIALLYRYLEMAGDTQPITTENHNEIASKYGQKSGHRLYQEFNKFDTPHQRTAKRKNGVKDLEIVIQELKNYPNAKALAEEELKTAKKKNQRF